MSSAAEKKIALKQIEQLQDRIDELKEYVENLPVEKKYTILSIPSSDNALYTPHNNVLIQSIVTHNDHNAKVQLFDSKEEAQRALTVQQNPKWLRIVLSIDENGKVDID